MRDHDLFTIWTRNLKVGSPWPSNGKVTKKFQTSKIVLRRESQFNILSYICQTTSKRKVYKS